MAEINLWARNIIYCVLFIRLLEVFISEGKWREYIHFIGGLLIIIQVIQPIIHIVNDETVLETYILEMATTLNNENYKTGNIMYSNINNHMSLELYQQRIEGQIRYLLKNKDYSITDIHVEVNEKTADTRYGEINNIEIVAKINKRTSQIASLEKLSKEALAIYYRKEITKSLEDFYKLNTSHINVNVEI